MRSLALVAVLLTLPAFAAQPTKRPTDAERGKELYERHCVACHGATAAGDGPATKALVFQVPDLQGKVQARQPQIDVVVRGKGAMPAFEASFDAEDARRVLLYMSTTRPAAPAPAPEPAAEPPPEDAQAPEGGQ